MSSPRVVAAALFAALLVAAASTGEMSVKRAEESGKNAEQQGLRFDELQIGHSGIPDLTPYGARDGTSLLVRRYPAESANPSEPASTDLVLVLLHGSGSHSSYLYPLASRIASAGVAHVYTPDLRGHGVAPLRRGDVDYVDQLEDDLADLIDTIGERHEGARVIVGGHSSGGGLAVRFAGSQYGGRSAGYLLMAPFLRHDAPTTRANAGGWARPKIGKIVGLSILNGLGINALDDAVVIEFDMPEAYRDGSETLAYTHRLNTGFAPRDFETDLAAIDTPLLVLVGADDEAFIAEQFGPTIKRYAPAARVEIVPEQSHLGIVSSERTAALAIEWLTSH